MYSLEDLRLIASARAFSIGAHSAVGQVRKYTGGPYHVHCQEVAEMVTYANGSAEMIAAAWLHDTIEDTHVTESVIREVFGNLVADMVVCLTDSSRYEDGNRAKRKAIDRARLAAATAEVQTIKCADLISNTRSIVQYDPNFAVVYLKEKQLLLEAMTKADSKLRELAFKNI